MPTKVDNSESMFDTGKFRIKVDKDTGQAVVKDRETGAIIPQVSGIVPRTNLTRSYLLTLVVMATIGVVTFIVISSGRPASELVGIGGMVFGFIATSTAVIVNFIKQQDMAADVIEAKKLAGNASAQSAETHLVVNSRMTETIATAVKAAMAQGMAEGMKIGREESEKRTDDLAKNKAEQPTIPE